MGSRKKNKNTSRKTIGIILLVNLTIVLLFLYFIGIRIRLTSIVSQMLSRRTPNPIDKTSDTSIGLELAPPTYHLSWNLGKQKFVGVIADSGLGNKMFNIAMAYAFCIRNNLPPPLVFYQSSSQKAKYTEWGGHDIGLPTFSHPIVPNRLKDVFPYIRFADVSCIEDISQHFSNCVVLDEISEEDYENVLPPIDPDDPECPNAFIFRGLWFAPVQFLQEEDIIRNNVMTFHPSIEKYVNENYEKLLSEYNYTAVQLRLGHQGDTFTMPSPTSQDINNFMKSAGTDKILVFTDNEQKAISLLGRDISYKFISDLPFIELCCMKRLKNFIISRSTFSWWGAFLMNKTHNANIAVCRDAPGSKLVLMHHCFETMIQRCGWKAC